MRIFCHLSFLSRHVYGLVGLFLLIAALAQPLCASEQAPGVIEKTGDFLPLSAVFTDEAGKSVSLGALLGKPAVLSFAYFSCKDQCNTVLSNLASSLGRMTPVPGEDFQVLTVSFDNRDTRHEAAHKRKNYISAAGRPMTDGAWRFLTGADASIEALTNAVGFGFRKTADGYDHPAALAVVSADGRIIRYFYGSSFLPADLEMALIEAKEGRITASIKKAARFCFGGEPGGRALFTSVLRWAGISTLALAAGLYFYISVSNKPGRPGRPGRPGKKDRR